jgi:hypothetical protein
MVELTCEYCGDSFEVYPYRADSAKFCSKSCSAKRDKPKRHKKHKYIGMQKCYLCPTCNQWKPPEDFYLDKRTANGLKSQCKYCHTQGNLKTRDPEKARVSTKRSGHKRRAKEYGVFVYAFTKEDWDKLDEMFPKHCQKCGSEENLTWDHIHALAKGGAHHPSNIQRLCDPCNNSKHTTKFDYRSTDIKGMVKSIWGDCERYNTDGRPG